MAVTNQGIVNTSFVVFTVKVGSLITLGSIFTLANHNIRLVRTLRYGFVVAAC